MRPLWTLLCQPTRFAGGGKTSVTGPSERCYVCLSAVPFFTEAGDVYVFAYKIKKSTLAFHGTLGPHIVTSFVSLHRSVLIDLETVTARRAQQPRVSRGLKARGRGSTRRQGGHRRKKRGMVEGSVHRMVFPASS